MPGRKWYAVALLLVLVGVAIAGLSVYRRLTGLAVHLPQIVVPGRADLTLSRPGTYTVYLEREAVVNGRLYATDDAIAGLRVRLTSAAGAPVEMTTPSVSSNYAIGGRAGQAVLAFTIADPGRYQLVGSYPDGRAEPQGVVAVGLDVPERIVSAIFQAMALAGIGFVSGVVVAVVTFMRRRRTPVRAAVAPA